MKHAIAFLLLTLVLCFAGESQAQSFGPISITGSGCASFPVEQQATVGFQVTGTWTGTIQPKAAVQGQAAFNVTVTPSTSSTPQSTVTGNGAFTSSVAGYNLFQVCGNTVTGTAKIRLNVSKASR